MRGSRQDLIAAVFACCDTLRGVGVGTLEDFERATRSGLAYVVALERMGESDTAVDYMLWELAIAEQEGMHMRALPDQDVARRCCAPDHPAVAA